MADKLDIAQQLTAELEKQEKILLNLKGVNADLALSVMQVAEGHKEGNKLSENEAKVAKDVLGVIIQQSRGSKLGIVAAKAKLGITKLFADKSSDITAGLLKQYDITQETAKEQKKSRFK